MDQVSQANFLTPQEMQTSEFPSVTGQNFSEVLANSETVPSLPQAQYRQDKSEVPIPRFSEFEEDNPHKRRQAKAEEPLFSEFEEDEPLLDGPVATPFVMQTHSFPMTKVARAMPAPLVHIVEEIIEPIHVTSQKGITKLEMVIQSKTLSEIKVTIDHYDTAPHCFNIEFSGSEQAKQLFIQYQPQLIQSLKMALPHFQITLLPPVFLAKTRRVSYGAKLRKTKSHE